MLPLRRLLALLLQRVHRLSLMYGALLLVLLLRLGRNTLPRLLLLRRLLLLLLRLLEVVTNNSQNDA